jgi:hypothetical protein
LLKELGAIFASIAMKTKYRCLLFHLKIIIVACNPSYSGGRDQEDLGSIPAQANSS